MRRDLKSIIVMTLFAGLASAQSYDIPAGVVGNGGGTIGVAGSYSITGTVGQPAVGSITQHEAGFWPAAQELTKAAGGLIGTYVIGTGEVYPTFNDAVNDLIASGVSGPVTFQVKAGTYNESVTIPLITGVSAANTITFEPDPANTGAVILRPLDPAASNWFVKLDGAQRVTIKELRFEATHNDNSRLIQLVGDADHINLIDNDFVGLTPTTASPASALVFGESYPPSTLFTADSLIIKGNSFENGSHGVYLYGYYLPMPTDAEISGNTFTEQLDHSVHLDQLDGPVINENTIRSVTGTDMIGIYLHSCVNDVEVSGNLIDLPQGGHGILGNKIIGTAAQPILIANNRMSIGGGSHAVGINLYGGTGGGGEYIQVLHNTVHIYSVDATNGVGLRLTHSATYDRLQNITLRNNIFVNTGGGKAISDDVALTTGYSSSYNDLYATGTYLIRWNGAEYGDLASFQSANTTLEISSISADPLFVHPDTLNYHLKDSSPAIGAGDGTIITSPIDFDIEGLIRPSAGSANPDLGAYENDLGAPTEDPFPAAPTGLVAVGGDGQVDLSWRANNEADFMRYRVYQSGFATGPWTRVDSTGYGLPLDTTRTIKSLNNGTTYFFQVKAVDTALQESGPSNVESATPSEDQPPAAPTGLVAVGGDGQATLTWSANSEPDLAKYRIYRDTSSPASTLIDSVVGSPPNAVYTDVGLAVQTYYYRITAVDIAGNESGFSNEDSATPQGAAAAPTVATGLATGISSSTAQLTAVVNPNGESTAWVFEYGTTTAYGLSAPIIPGTLSGTSDVQVTTLLSSLSPGTIYHYRVAATNAGGTSYGEDRTFTTTASQDITVDNQVVTGSGEVSFPNTDIGMNFSFSGTPGTNSFQVTLFGNSWPDGTIPDSLEQFSSGYWEINHTTGAGTFTVNLTFDLGFAIAAGRVPEDFWLMRRGSGGTGEWELLTQGSLISGSTLTFTGIDAFSQFTITEFIPDTEPPTITFVSSDLEPPVEIGSYLNITAQVSDDRALAVVDLFYGPGDASSFTSVEMTESGSSPGYYDGQIPYTAVDLQGVAYTVKATDEATNVKTWDTVYVSVTFPGATLDTNLPNSAYPGAFPQNKWRLFSVPAALDTPNVVGTIGDELGELNDYSWKTFRYLSGDYVENPTNFVPGEGFWIYQTVESSTALKAGSGRIHDLSGFDITLKPGWNVIGTPYPFVLDVNLNEAEFYGPITYGTPAGEGWSDVLTKLKPWGGYAVKNKGGTDKILTLGGVQLGKQLGKEKAAPLVGWRLVLKALGATYVDEANTIGRLEGAQEELDYFDNPEPPYIDGFVSLAMDRPDWGEKVPQLTSDIRSLEQTDGVWEMALRVKGEMGPIRLTHTLEGDFPIDGKVMLLDQLTRAVYDLTGGTQPIAITDYREDFPYRLSLVVGSAGYVDAMTEEILARLPDAFALSQNYPNPFNPSTTLTYSVYRPAKVRLAVYDLIGREVVILVDGWQDMGYHKVIWNGLDAAGNSVASGVYFAVYRAEQKIRTRKMVLLK